MPTNGNQKEVNPNELIRHYGERYDVILVGVTDGERLEMRGEFGASNGFVTFIPYIQRGGRKVMGDPINLYNTRTGEAIYTVYIVK